MPVIHLPQALTILQAAIRKSVPRAGFQIPVVEAVGCVAAETVVALIDHPPSAQSLRDGVAYASPPNSDALERWSKLPFLSDTENVRELVGEVFPGDPSPPPLSPGQAIRIMTGATVPESTSGVAMIEEVEWLCALDRQWQSSKSSAAWSIAQSATHVRLQTQHPQLHVLPQGAIYHCGAELIHFGTRLNPVHIGLLSSTGRESLACFAEPRISVLTTGDELIPPGRQLRSGQIYNSNGALLQALLRQTCRADVTVQHLGDSETQIAAWLEQQLGHTDLILTTGAVSAGQKDQLPALFSRFGVQTLFHGVNIKPGKPVYCGRFDLASTTALSAGPLNTMVLGLPGNPISVWVTFQLFARPLIESLRGSHHQPRWVNARLSKSGNYQDNRLTFWPGRLHWTSSPWDATDRCDSEESGAMSLQHEPIVTPLEWQGSPDLRAPTEANCLIYFSSSSPAPQAESRVKVLLLPDE
ncbi:MAG: molybdopterin molybdotransferase MoeA [Pirellulaceae bacterium]|nr:molybdopterin molybdotransferase MoeA [Pirellulaceae bacterium]